MKITICGSIAFIDEMQEVKRKLEELGHDVKIPPSEIVGENGETVSAKDFYVLRKAANAAESWIWDRKAEAIRDHFNKVEWSDAVLILNYSKNNILGYIGANTLLEMGLAFYFKKKIFLFNPIPNISYREEILGMRPAVINGDLKLINSLR